MDSLFTLPVPGDVTRFLPACLLIPNRRAQLAGAFYEAEHSMVRDGVSDSMTSAPVHPELDQSHVWDSSSINDALFGPS
jgi:UPF0716 family protein affecting phage T7 exclusion